MLAPSKTACAILAIHSSLLGNDVGFSRMIHSFLAALTPRVVAIDMCRIPFLF